MKTTAKIKFFFLFLLTAGCASPEREPCPSVEAEPVSTCRAIEKCRDQRTSYGMGVGVGISPNVGIGISQSQNSESYTNCIDQDLKEQENKAKLSREVPGEKPAPAAGGNSAPAKELK
jgi:hypothetical protein